MDPRETPIKDFASGIKTDDEPGCCDVLCPQCLFELANRLDVLVGRAQPGAHRVD
jgi:hypothetical protein